MAVIITLDTLKNILKKFQGIIFNKYDNKITQIEQKNFNQDSNLQDEITRAVNKENELNTKLDSLNSEIIDNVNVELSKINKKMPIQATETNKLADKDFVNSSIATATAEFIGTYNSLTEIKNVSYDNNDYCFIVGKDSDGNTKYSRYKWNGTEWIFEYDLNNSSFTAEQWKAINSNVTADWKSNVDTELDNKVEKVSGKGLSTNDYTTTEKNKLAGISTGANKTVVDATLSSTSTNPVQNKVIYNVLSNKVDKSQINGVLKTFICTTSGIVTSKTLTVDNFVLEKGVTIRVCFENGNRVPHPTLNVSGTGAKEIVVNNYNGYIKRLETNGGSLTTGMYSWGSKDVILTLYYNGTYWVAENTLIYSWDSGTHMLNGEKEIFGKISFGSITDETSKDVLIEDLLFTDTNYNIQVTCESSNAGNETYVLYNTKTTSSVKIRIYNRNSSTKMENVSVYYRMRGY
jgi:hypothetical protein